MRSRSPRKYRGSSCARRESTLPGVLASTAETILDYFRVLAWPVVALVIAFMFREKLRELVDRLREVSFFGGGAKLEPAPPRQTVSVSEEAEHYAEQVEAAAEAEHYAEELGAVADAAEEAIAGQLAQAEELARQVGRLEAQLDLEQHWNRIFGSQVAALRALDAAPQGLTRQALEPIYEEGRRRGLVLPFDQWMAFLLRDGLGGSLVAIAPDGTYLITQKGGALLGYGDASGFGPRLY